MMALRANPVHGNDRRDRTCSPPVIIAEGNYLLLNQGPWLGLLSHFDCTVKIVTPIEILEQRLVARWRGYKLPEAEVQRKVGENDLPNARFVIDNSGEADFSIAT